MSLLIAGVALLGFLAATYAQDRRFSALASFAAGSHASVRTSEANIRNRGA